MAPEALAEKRIADLPAAERASWLAYLKRSNALREADKTALAAEREGLALVPAPPAAGRSGGSFMPLNQDPAWYGSREARQVADNILSFQTPSGGWSKNQDRAGAPRLLGQSYTLDEKNWGYVGTLDNNATTSELRFLALVQARFPGADGDAFRAGFLKAIRYLLTAQYPHGGWPQVFPLQGGYHDAIAFNDNAFVKAATLLREVGEGREPFTFVPGPMRADAKASADRALRLVLGTQVVVDGRRSIWGQQHDALTLVPVGARNFEPVSLSTSESVGLLLFLMKQPEPSPEIVDAVTSGIAWLKAHALKDVTWLRSAADGPRLVAQVGAEPLWARFYDIRTGQPIFGDRDKSIHNDVNALSPERRAGYAWFNTAPQQAVKAYESWSKGQAR